MSNNNDIRWDKLVELLDLTTELFQKHFPESNELDVFEDLRLELVSEVEKIKENQPADSVTQTVMHKLAARSHKGVNTYGKTMDRSDLTEIEWLQHLHEELLDGSVYCQKLINHKIHGLNQKP